MSRLFDPRRKDGTFPFEYKGSANTDVRETIRKARERIAANQQQTRRVVAPIKKEKP